MSSTISRPNSLRSKRAGQTQQPATEVLIAIPDPSAERNLLAIEVPRLGSFIASGTWDAKEVGLEAFPPEDRPPVFIPFFAIPPDGRNGPDHAGGFLVRNLAALARNAGHYSLVPVGGVPVVSHRLRLRARRVVHRGGRPSAVGGLRPSAHQGRGDAPRLRPPMSCFRCWPISRCTGDLRVRFPLRLSSAA